MDPNACLQWIGEHTLKDSSTREHCEALKEWISRGGFLPEWDKYPDGTERYRRYWKLPEKTFRLVWSPEGKTIATVTAHTKRAAIRRAPLPYRKFKGEIYAELGFHDCGTPEQEALRFLTQDEGK